MKICRRAIHFPIEDSDIVNISMSVDVEEEVMSRVLRDGCIHVAGSPFRARFAHLEKASEACVNAKT